MADLTLSVLVSRDLLGLTDLEVNDPGNYKVADLLGGTQERNRASYGAPFTDGQRTAHSALRNVAEPFVIEVFGDNPADLGLNLAVLLDAFAQDQFTVTVTMDGHAEVYVCESSDAQTVWAGPRMMARQAQVTLNTPRLPATPVQFTVTPPPPEITLGQTFTFDGVSTMSVVPVISGHLLSSFRFDGRSTMTVTPTLTGDDTPGAAPLGTTAYSAPGGAIYVAPAGPGSTQGNDVHLGAIGSPVATMSRALALAPAGGTIVLRAGTYHDAWSTSSTKAVTVQAAASEAVWFDGAETVTGFVPSAGHWVKNGWTTQFSNASGTGHTGVGWDRINPAHPMAGWPDQVWIDGVQQIQVGSTGELAAGNFYVDYTADQLWIGTDPAGKVVEASTLSIACRVRTAGSRLRGIGFRRFAASLADLSAVRVEVPGCTVENVFVNDCSVRGLGIYNGAGNTVRQVTTANNGMVGTICNYADNLTVDRLLSYGNNREHFNSSPDAGGMKITRSRGVTVKGSVLRDNLATGLWFDESVYDIVVVNSQLTGNSKHGCSIEICEKAVFANNLVTGNGSYGLKVNNSGHVRTWINSIVGNGSNEVIFVEDARRNANPSDPGHDPRQGTTDPTVPWILAGCQLVNNIIGKPGVAPTLLVKDLAGGGLTPASMLSSFDYNRFTTLAAGVNQIGWGTANYHTTAAFTAAVGTGSHNSEAAGDITTQIGSGGSALPTDIATLCGLTPGVTVIGAA